MTSTLLIDRRPPQRSSEVSTRALIDGSGRTVSYLRLSVTDRCDLRCTYCMPEKMTFLPKSDLLSLDELDRLASTFIARGVRKLRITGGEPLVRRDIITFIEGLGRHLRSGALQDLVLTTNGTQLSRFADRIAKAGVKRVNVSLDHLDPDRFAAITRGGDIRQVMTGLDAAKAAGLQIKINMVALAGQNIDHVETMMRWAHGEGFDLTLIEAMPLGDAGGDRDANFINLSQVKADLATQLTLRDSAYATLGPSRYVEVAETGGRLGFITPLSHNFCSTCNRVRLTCTGQLYTCLGHEGAADLRAVIRSDGDLNAAIDQALSMKPERHDFDLANPGQLSTARHMSVTGG